MRSDFRIGEWIIRPRLDCIERGDETVHIHPKPMAVLQCLAAAGGEVVTRKKLFENVWPGAQVTDDALTQCIVELRKALGDSAQYPRIIRTVPKVGFCLIPPVSALADDSSDTEKFNGKYRLKTTAWAFVALILITALVTWYLGMSNENPLLNDTGPEIPIAVIPLLDLSEERDLQYFADGLTEDLSIALGRVKGLSVMARSSTFQFRNRNEDLRVMGAMLGVNYLLEGSVRKDGRRVRICVQLLDASSGFQVWSETYDRNLENTFKVQDEITESVVHALKKRLGLPLEVEQVDFTAPDRL